MAEGSFVRVPCTTCNREDVWLKCDGCGRQALFSSTGEQVLCECSKSYDHAICLCGAKVPAAQLQIVPFAEGPVTPGEMEIDWLRVGGVLLVVGAVVAGIAYTVLA